MFVQFSRLAPIALAAFLCVSFPRGAAAIVPSAHIVQTVVLQATSVTPCARYFYRGRRFRYRHRGMYFNHRTLRGGRFHYF